MPPRAFSPVRFFLFLTFLVLSLASPLACDSLPPKQESATERPPESHAEATSENNVEAQTEALLDATSEAPLETLAERPPEAPPESIIESAVESVLEQEQPTESLPEEAQDGAVIEHPTEKDPEAPRPEGQAEASFEAVAEQQPDTPSAIQARALSLITPFLEQAPLSGLMETDAQKRIWEITLWLPAGSFSFGFRRDEDSQHLGLLTQPQAPYQGTLQPQQAPIQITLPQAGRYTFRADLQQGSFQLIPQPQTTAIRIEGLWNQMPNQQQLLTFDAQSGLYTADLTMQAGNAELRISLQQQGAWVAYSLAQPAYGAFPQGGTLIPQAPPTKLQIPQDETYRVTVDPKDLSFTIHFKPDDPVQRYQMLLQQLGQISDPAQKNALLLPFMRRLRALRQIPIVKGREIIFLLWWSMLAPASVAGTFNNWTPGQHTMQRISGTDFYHLKITLPQDGQYAYKFVDSATTPQWITDPYNRRFEYGPFGENSIFQTEANNNASTLEALTAFQATKLNNQRTLTIYLPPNYKTSQRRYPVMYMHDGQNLFDTKALWGGWDVKGWADQLIQEGKIKPLIIVGIANTPGRMDEYTHTQDRVGGQLVGGKAADYADFLLRDIKPLINGMYRTRPHYRQNALMGSSLGGLISLWLGTHHPKEFFRIGALSSTFGWGKIAEQNPTLGEIIQQKGYQSLAIYIDSGSPQDNYQVTLQMRDLLKGLDYIEGFNLLHWVEQGAIHNEQAWRNRLDRPLRYLWSWP
jgi:predicted alpha/beta superfamily hydrolase